MINNLAHHLLSVLCASEARKYPAATVPLLLWPLCRIKCAKHGVVPPPAGVAGTAQTEAATAKAKRRVCPHQSRSSSDSKNAFGPVEGGFPRLSLLSGSPNVAFHTAVCSFQTDGCIMRIEMRGGRFAVMNQANQRLPSLDVQARPKVF